MRRGGGGRGGGGGGRSGYRPLAIPRPVVLRWACLEGTRRSAIGGTEGGVEEVALLQAASAGVGIQTGRFKKLTHGGRSRWMECSVEPPHLRKKDISSNQPIQNTLIVPMWQSKAHTVALQKGQG